MRTGSSIRFLGRAVVFVNIGAVCLCSCQKGTLDTDARRAKAIARIDAIPGITCSADTGWFGMRKAPVGVYVGRFPDRPLADAGTLVVRPESMRRLNKELANLNVDYGVCFTNEDANATFAPGVAAAFRGGPHLRELDMPYQLVPWKANALALDGSRVVALPIRGPIPSPAFASLLARCPNVRDLRLSHMQLNAEEVRAIASLGRLDWISLSGVKFAGDAWDGFARVKATSLSLHLVTLPTGWCQRMPCDLRMLWVDGSVREPFDVMELPQALEGLTLIHIDPSHVHGLGRRASLREFRFVHHEGLSRTDQEFASLGRQIGELRELQGLVLDRCRIDLTSLESLGRLENLEVLTLENCRFDPKGWPALASLTRLRELRATGPAVTDEMLAHFTDLTRLETLDLWACEKVTDATVSALLRKNLGLRRVTLTSPHVTDACVELLVDLKKLEDLDVGCSGISPTGMQKLVEAHGNRVVR